MRINNSFSNFNTVNFSKMRIQRISKPSPDEAPVKVLGYEVDINGYFKSDFNKAAGIPDDFKIHSETLASLKRVEDNTGFFYHHFKKFDIAKTVGNAYKILTQLVSDDFLKKDKFSYDDIASMPQGYDYNKRTLNITRVFQTAKDYMAHDSEMRPEEVTRTTTFYNHSIRNYWSCPEGTGILKPSSDIFDSNKDGQESLDAVGLYFNTTKELYTDSEGNVSKGGLLVGIINSNLNVRDGETTFVGKMAGYDKKVSASYAKLQSAMFFTINPVLSHINDDILNDLPEDMRDFVKALKKGEESLLAQSGSTHHCKRCDDEEFENFKSPIDLLYELMLEEKKHLLQSLKRKAKEARLQEQREYARYQNEQKLQKEQQEAINDINEFVNSFMRGLDNHNKSSSLENRVNLTKAEIENAFLSLFSSKTQRVELKSSFSIVA